MELKAKLASDLKEAMRAKDSVRLETIRAIRAAITQSEVSRGAELDEAAICELIRGLRKQRTEAIEQYEAGGRADLAARELAERALLEAYLPTAPDARAMEDVVQDLVAELPAPSMRDMGTVVAAAKARLPGVDGAELSGIVKRLLSGK